MLGGRSKSKPASAGDFSASDEESDLNTLLQNQLEEDVGRIFDESLYSDLEVVCGKSKIYLNSCILKTRSSKFLSKLESILHVNIGSNIFDEIYSFVSDVYTECNIELQESEIISFMNETFNSVLPPLSAPIKVTYPNIEKTDDADEKAILDCTVKSYTENLLPTAKSPSTEFTKEYYSLLPMNGNLLDKELLEQEKLSNAFLSIIKAQVEDKTKVPQNIKPTSLPISDNTSTKYIKQSDPLFKCEQSNCGTEFEEFNEKLLQKNCVSKEKKLDSAYTPDSLVTEEPSSSSDYLSATFTCSPGTSFASHNYNLIIGENNTKMERYSFDISDPGLVDSNNSHVEATLQEHSLTRGNVLNRNEQRRFNLLKCKKKITFEEEEYQTQESHPSTSVDHILVGIECKVKRSEKEEKQRLNKELATLESSSESGSWIPKKVPNTSETLEADDLQRQKCSASCVHTNSENSNQQGNCKQDDDNQEKGIPIPFPKGGTRDSKNDSSELSEGDDNEDSLEILDQIDHFDSCDDSGTLFNMTFESSKSENNEAMDNNMEPVSITIQTPNNSIMSVREHNMCDDNEENTIFENQTLAETTYVTLEGQSNNDKNNKENFSHSTPNTSTSLHVNTFAQSESITDPKISPVVCDEIVPDNSKHAEKCIQTFYIDLSSLPEPVTDDAAARVNEKDSMFSMYIDIGKNSILKKKPPTLQSEYARKSSESDSKISDKKKTKSTPIISGFQNNSSLMAFERLESLCDDPNLSITEIIKIPENNITEIKPNAESEEKENHQAESANRSVLQDPILESSDLVKEPSNLFVKLSDMDKPISKPANLEKIESKHEMLGPFNENKIWDTRMTRSIPDNTSSDGNYSDYKFIGSFHSENALSLNRLFPNLLNNLSKSVPACLSSRTLSPIILENLEGKQDSDTSEISSIQSSVSRFINDQRTTEESSRASGLFRSCNSRLGQDLLRMFIEGIQTDVVVDVNGKRMKAHKCILSSRCQFFAGILSGGYVESAGNVIVLPPFSYDVVHFAMCHIYAGISLIPETISIVELATLADMLGLDGLKEAIMYNLKTKYCHSFHKPCQICIAGVLECFPLSSVYGLDDLYLKCLKWINKYFVDVWPTKAFATLPTELIDKCYHHLIINFTTENFVETVYGFGLTKASLQNCKWSAILMQIMGRLMAAASHFAAARLVEILRVIGHTPYNASSPALHALQECITCSIEWAQPDETCRAYAFLSLTVEEIKSHISRKTDWTNKGNRTMTGSNNLLFYHAASWRLQCEGALVRDAPRVVITKAFQDLPCELKKRLRELGCIIFAPRAMPQMTWSQYDKNKSHDTKNSYSSPTSRSLDMEHVRAAFVPYCIKPVIPFPTTTDNNYFNETLKPNRSQTPKVRMTKAQEQRAKFNMSKNVQNVVRRQGKQFAVKSKYLEPKSFKENEKQCISHNRNMKIVSSNESSQNSSPIQGRRQQYMRHEINQSNDIQDCAISQDSLSSVSRPRTAEPATDSLSESQNSNKYATYTKNKHTIKGSVESIKCMKCQGGAAGYSCLTSQPKTKIPVTTKQNLNAQSKQTTDMSKRLSSQAGANTGINVATKYSDRKPGGSLMNATKSSSAKMVHRVVKEQSKPVKGKEASTSSTKSEEREVPTLNRSTTFLFSRSPDANE